MKIFVVYGKAGFSQEFTDLMKEVLQRLRADQEIELLEFDPVGSDTKRQIDLADTDCLTRCDLCVVVCGEVSFWVGAYFDRALSMGKSFQLLIPQRLSGSRVVDELVQLVHGNNLSPGQIGSYRDVSDGEINPAEGVVSAIKQYIAAMRFPSRPHDGQPLPVH